MVSKQVYGQQSSLIILKIIKLINYCRNIYLSIFKYYTIINMLKLIRNGAFLAMAATCTAKIIKLQQQDKEDPIPMKQSPIFYPSYDKYLYQFLIARNEDKITLKNKLNQKKQFILGKDPQQTALLIGNFLNPPHQIIYPQELLSMINGQSPFLVVCYAPTQKTLKQFQQLKYCSTSSNNLYLYFKDPQLAETLHIDNKDSITVISKRKLAGSATATIISKTPILLEQLPQTITENNVINKCAYPKFTRIETALQLQDLLRQMVMSRDPKKLLVGNMQEKKQQPLTVKEIFQFVDEKEVVAAEVVSQSVMRKVLKVDCSQNQVFRLFDLQSNKRGVFGTDPNYFERYKLQKDNLYQDIKDVLNKKKLPHQEQKHVSNIRNLTIYEEESIDKVLLFLWKDYCPACMISKQFFQFVQLTINQIQNNQKLSLKKVATLKNLKSLNNLKIRLINIGSQFQKMPTSNATPTFMYYQKNKQLIKFQFLKTLNQVMKAQKNQQQKIQLYVYKVLKQIIDKVN